MKEDGRVEDHVIIYAKRKIEVGGCSITVAIIAI